MKKLIKKLKPWSRNKAFRKISLSREKELYDSLKKHGQIMTLLVDGRDGETVLGGNHQLKAMKQLGFKEAEVIVKTPKNDKEALELALKHNSHYATYEVENLIDLVADIDLDVSDIHISTEELNLDKLLNDRQAEGIEEDDFDKNVDKVDPVSKLGDIFELGEHRLMCGDSSKFEEVKKLMDGNKAEMMFIDPPYNVQYTFCVDEERRKDWGEIRGDNLSEEEHKEFLMNTTGYAGHFLEVDSPMYVCCNWQSILAFLNIYEMPNAFIVWDKGSIGLGAGYRNQHEFILFYGTLDHNSESNVWTIKRDVTFKYNHPTQKPIAIPARAIKNHKANGVIDLFGGSGTTLLACEQLDRKCYMMELDPHYCDVIIARWEKLTNKKHKKL